MKNEDMRTLSFLPCYIKNDDELLSKDVDRLRDARAAVEAKSSLPDGKSLALHALKYLLCVDIFEAQGKEITEAQSKKVIDAHGKEIVEATKKKNASICRYYYSKKQLLARVYGKLKASSIASEENVMPTKEEVKEFLSTLPGLNYDTMSVDPNKADEYGLRESDLSDSDDDDDNADYDSDENEGRKTSKDRFARKLTKRDLASKKRREDNMLYASDEENVPLSSSSEEEDENSDEESQPRSKTRNKNVLMSNVHKDCFLFNDCFYFCYN
jgi:hypothetical protein